MSRPFWHRAGLMILALVVPAGAGAQESAPADRWQFAVAPYFLLPSMNGTIGVGRVEVDVDVSPGDIFSSLKFGGMLAAEATKGPWAIGFNGLYMNLGKDGKRVFGPAGGVTITGSAENYQGALELAGFRRLSPVVEVLAGGRVNFLGATVSVDPPNQTFSKDADQTWFDPFVGARLRVPGTGKWTVLARGDIGGFGVGSDLAWQARGTVGYRVSQLFELAAAYWVVNMDYEGKLDSGTFRYDLTTSGPELALVFHF